MHISIKTLLILLSTSALSIGNLWAADRFAGVEVKAQLVSGYANWGKGFINTSRWISIIKSDLENR